ncbi:uncharacterized protein LOC108592327 [Callithrix jacchus]
MNGINPSIKEALENPLYMKLRKRPALPRRGPPLARRGPNLDALHVPSRPAPGPLASPPATTPSCRRSATTDSYGCSSRGHQGPTPGTSASGPRAPKHSPRRRRGRGWGAGNRGCRPRHRGPRSPAGRLRTGGRQRRLAQAATTLTCRRPRAGAAAAASLVVVALARRLRPPPPRSLSLPPPPGLMRDPRFLLRKPRPGKGAPEPPKSRRSSPAAAACPHRGSAGPSGQGLQAASYCEEEPKEAPPPAAERAGSAEVKPDPVSQYPSKDTRRQLDVEVCS